MAVTFSRASQIATRGKNLADRLKALDRDVQDFLSYNSAHAIDWGAAQKPATVTEDADGNIEGHDFAHQDLANLIGTLAALDTLLDAGHRGNVQKVASANA